MFKAKTALMCLITLFACLAVCSGYDYHTFNDADATDHKWSTPGNWDIGVPHPTDPNAVALIDCDTSNTGNYCLIDDTQDESVQFCYVGYYTDAGMLMTGGNFNCVEFRLSGVGPQTTDSYFEMTGGTATVDRATLSFGNYVSDVYCYLRGGVFEVTTAFGINSRQGRSGHLEIERDATFIVNGDVVTLLNGYIGSGFITHPYGSRGRWLIDYNQTNAGKTTLRSFFDPNEAYAPSPGIGATIIQQSVLLGWTAGDSAVSHELYFGTDEAAVAQADNTDITGIYKGTHGPGTYTASGLELGETYYWRVDEVDSNGYRTAGRLWQFSVAAFEVIDNMESYTTGDIASAWVNSGGASVDVSTFRYRDAQSMQVEYTSAPGAVTRTLPAPENWTDNSAESISLFVHGSLNNDGNDLTLYFEIGDSSVSAKQYYIGGIEELRRDSWEGWLRWDVDLGPFADAGVDLTKVESFAIGYEYDGTEVGSGLLYFDEIRLYAGRCIGAYSKPRGDIAMGDCEVDGNDFVVLGTYWGDSGEEIYASAPDDANLLVWYKFDESSGFTASDSSVNGYHGFTSDFSAHWDSQGAMGGCISFDGLFSVTVPPAVFTTVSEEVTFSLWVNGDIVAQPENNGSVFQGGNWPTRRVYQAYCPFYSAPDAMIYFRAGQNGTTASYDNLFWSGTRTSDWAGQWNHYAFVKDLSDDDGIARMSIYQNGVLVTTSGGKTKSIDLDVSSEFFSIGSNTNGTLPYIGKVDDFRIYNKALSQEEIVSLAGKSSVFQPLGLGKVADVNDDNYINLQDLVDMANGWLQDASWPY